MLLNSLIDMGIRVFTIEKEKLLCALCAVCALFAANAFAAKVTIIPAPANSLVPDAAVDSSGALHLVFGLNHNAWYMRSDNNGASFTAPVKVNSTGTVETEMGERGPKLAVGGDGVIHVAWMDDWAAGVKVYVRYSRSLDGGKTFEARKTVSAMSGVDGATLAADGAGNVAAFWHVMADPKPSEPQATWLHTARSNDNGTTFGASEKINASGLAGIACSMCMMRARATSDGSVCLAFRNAEGNIRDFYVLKGRIAENNFTAARVNQDNWNINYCPMCGPELTFAPNGQALCAFMSENKVYWAISDTGMTTFSLHVATPSNETDEIFPTAIANRNGDALFVWQVGPMSTASTATVKWACYATDGSFSGKVGTAGTSFSGTKATAFVGSDDDFYIVTTAILPPQPPRRAGTILIR
ncbi:MAG: sialidase family protein [Candidatus Sumerlaeota bacterium]|nr:sialidase family protein [Candidatus Sumerlaeota bacterium]